MVFLKRFYFKFLVLLLVHSGVATDFANNACYDVNSYYFSAFNSDCYYNPDISPDNNLITISSRHGYDTETFDLRTDDGYHLELYRMSSCKVSRQKTKAPVFFLYGLLCNVEFWVCTGNKSFAFNFVDKGYDVWVGTLRGSKDTNRHDVLTVEDSEYWNYNLDTLANEDLRIQLEFVATITDQKVFVVGYSMGTTLTFMFASEHSDRASQLIKGFIALAPVVYLDDVEYTKSAIPWGFPLIQILKACNIKGLFFYETIIHAIDKYLCKLAPLICYNILTISSGPTKQLAPENLFVFLSYWPSGASIYQFEQYLQFTKDGKFQKFDYGADENTEIYGTENPPVYDLGKVRFPVGLFYGKQDVLYLEKNNQRLLNELGSREKLAVSVPSNAGEEFDFAHIDFLWSKHIAEFLFNDIFKTLDLFTKSN